MAKNTEARSILKLLHAQLELDDSGGPLNQSADLLLHTAKKDPETATATAARELELAEIQHHNYHH